MTNTRQANCGRIEHTHDFQPGIYSNWWSARLSAALSYLPPGPLCRFSVGDTYCQCKRLFSNRFCLCVYAKPDDRRFPAPVSGDRHIGRVYDIFSIFSGNIASHTKRLTGQRVFEYHSFNHFVPACLLCRNRHGKEFINSVIPAFIYTGHVVINYD